MRALLLTLAATVAACAQATAPGGSSAAAPSSAASTISGALAASEAVVAVQRVRKSIDWNAADAHPRLATPPAPAQLPPLRRASLPVLLPDAVPWTTAGIATAEADWYTLSYPLGDLTVVVQGDRMATVDPQMVPPRWLPPTWQQPLLTRNEGIVEATFLAFGASYVVAVECAMPDSDWRCTQDQFVLDLVAGLRRWSHGGGVMR